MGKTAVAAQFSELRLDSLGGEEMLVEAEVKSTSGRRGVAEDYADGDGLL